MVKVASSKALVKMKTTMTILTNGRDSVVAQYQREDLSWRTSAAIPARISLRSWV